jgi:hypothetical protein
VKWGLSWANLKGKLREAVGKAQSSEEMSAYPHMKMVTSMEEPEPACSKYPPCSLVYYF